MLQVLACRLGRIKMEKIKSAIEAVVKQCRRLGAGLKDRFPAASERLQVTFAKCVAFCKARPRVSLSVAAVLVLMLTVGSCSRDDVSSEVGSEGLVYKVTRGPLTISVASSGTIENKDKVIYL